MSAPPLIYRYEGEGVWSPSTPFVARRADQHYVIGMDYPLIEHQERSEKSHSHYFASIKNAWENLPDVMLDQYPTTEHLRKKALIRTGHADERSIVCASKAEAQRMAAFMKPFDDYAIIVAKEKVVTVYTAKSQRMSAMDKEQFQKSKQDVLDFIDNVLGVERGQTQSNGGQ